MLSILSVLLIVLGLTVLGLLAGTVVLRHSHQSTGHESTGHESTGHESTGHESSGPRDNPRACECCHNSTEVERPVV